MNPPNVFTVTVWKEHRCVGCGTAYRYRFQRKKVGHGRNQEEARANAQEAVRESMRNELAMQPCPGCGMYQPDMIASRRWRRHGYLMAYIVVPLIGLAFLLGFNWIALSEGSLLLAALLAVVSLAHLCIDFLHPNRNLAANLRLARQRLDDDELRSDDDLEGRQLKKPIGSGRTLGHRLGYLLLAASVLLILAPLRLLFAEGMNRNTGWFPEIVGPGDSAKVYFPKSIGSVKGLWRGDPQVVLLDAGKGDPPARETWVGATASQDSWGDRISFEKKEGNSNATLWATVYLEDDPALVGRTLRLRIDMPVQFPALVTDDRFTVKEERHTHTVELTVSRQGAQAVWLTNWITCSFAGVVLSFLAGILLAFVSRAFANRALPTETYVPRKKKLRNPLDEEPPDEVPMTRESLMRRYAIEPPAGPTYQKVHKINVWKEHHCVGCGTTYRYLLKRVRIGSARSSQAAAEQAHAARMKAIENEVEMQPCPGCGLYQPDMVGNRRWQRHGYVFLASVWVFAILAVPAFTQLLPFAIVGWSAAGAGALLALWHLFIDRNPNRNLEANRALARKRQEAGDLWVAEESNPEPAGARVGSGISRGQRVGYCLLVLGVLALLGPAIATATLGMKLNQWFHPEVIGPGEEAWFSFPGLITSTHGKWRGKVSVRVLHAEELGLPPSVSFSGRSNDDEWDDQSNRLSGAPSDNAYLWAYIRAPNDPALAGKSVDLQIDLDVVYPVAAGNNTFIDKVERRSKTVTLAVSPPGAGRTYVILWWACMGVGAGLILLCGPLLAFSARTFRRQALPASVFVPKTDDVVDDRLPHEQKRDSRRDSDQEDDGDVRDDRYRR